MIKVVIIDDDIEMLQGLENIVQWPSYEVSIVGKAKNGYDGLNLVTELMPDVIITDITMPQMNGLEVIREAKKFKPDIKSIIISCHEDFQYAKEAIRLEADEYILKHTLTRDELLTAVLNIKDKIMRERLQKDNLIKATHKINTNKYVILENFFFDLMEKKAVTGQEIYESAEIMDVALPKDGFRAISFYADNYEDILARHPIHEPGLFKFAVLNIIEETAARHTDINFFPHGKNSFAILYWENIDDRLVLERIRRMIQQIQENVQMFLNVRLSACVGRQYNDIQCLQQSLLETEALRAAYFYQGPGQIIVFGAVTAEKDEDLYARYGQEFKDALATRNQETITGSIYAVLDAAEREQYAPRCVKALLLRMAADMAAMLGKSQISPDTYFAVGDTFASCKRSFCTMMEHMLQTMSEARNKSSRPEIKRVIEYIESHLSEEITCESMASYANMNSNYFSRLFKNEIGLSFSDYIMRKRMSVATDLLGNSSYSIEEIARAIGIGSISYFYRAYKKITGNTPGDVRSKNL